jgi:hypothetical protein
LGAVATILELSRRANVPAAQVLRVLNGEPVRAEVAARVEEAITALGPPPYPGLPANAVAEDAPAPAVPTASAPARGAAGEEPAGDVTSVSEALRVEVRPVAERVSQVGRLVDELAGRLEHLRNENARQRNERIEELELLTELVTSGWQSVDRRLGRLEELVERLSAEMNGQLAARSLAEPD